MAEYMKGTNKVIDDSSLMTYRGHTVLQTLIRCRFSPAHTTAQRYIYTGCATGSVYGKLSFSFLVLKISYQSNKIIINFTTASITSYLVYFSLRCSNW